MARRFQYKSLTYVALVTSSSEVFIPVYSQGANHIVIPIRFQYQGRFETHYVPFVAENVTIDKWFQPLATPKRAVKNEHLYPTHFAGLSLLLPDLARWAQPINEPPKSKRAKPHLYPSTFFDPSPIQNPEEVTVEKWFVQHNLPPKGRGKTNFQYPGFFYDSTIFTPKLDEWLAKDNNVPRDKKRTAHHRDGFFFVPPPVETVNLDKWFQPIRQPVRPKTPKNRGSFSFVEDLPDVTYIPVFSQSANHIVVPVRFQYQSLFRVFDPLSGVETVNLDKWFQPIQTPPAKAKRGVASVPAVTSPVYFVAPQIIFEVSQPRRTSRPMKHLETGTFRPVAFTVPDVLFTVSQLLPRQKKLQYLYQFYFAFDGSTSENVTLDKWFIATIIPTRRRRSYAHLLPASVADKFQFIAYNGIILGYDNDTNTVVGRRIMGNLGRDTDSGVGVGQRGAINIGWDRDTNTGIGKKLP